MEIRVFAPASVANIGVGYDILGFALESPGDEVVARFSDGKGMSIGQITGTNRLPFSPESVWFVTCANCSDSSFTFRSASFCCNSCFYCPRG